MITLHKLHFIYHRMLPYTSPWSDPISFNHFDVLLLRYHLKLWFQKFGLVLFYIGLPPPSLSLGETQCTAPRPRFGDNLGNRHTVSSRGCWMRQKRSGSWWGTPCPRGQTHVLCPRGSSWRAWPPAPGSQPQAWPRSARGRSQRGRGRALAQEDWAQAPPHWSWPGSACPEPRLALYQSKEN